jgi:hypothetical protein
MSVDRETQQSAASGIGMIRIRHILGVSAVVVLGCTAPTLETDAGDESETDESETVETETDETDESETETETSSGDDPCPTLCMVQDECAPDPYYSYADCLDTCADEFEVAIGTPACLPALTEFYACVGGLTCEQFDVLFDDESGPCFPAAVEFEEQCGEALSCELSGGGDEQGSYCSYQFDCYGSGLHRVECSAETGCTCLLEGVEVGSCDALYPALCEPLDPVDPNQTNMQILGHMNECCGWALEI